MSRRTRKSKENKRNKILIVDDERFMRNLLKKIISPKEYKIIEATDGLDAANKYKEHRPDLVIMDIIMPNLDGIAALELILKLDKYARVVMCSTAGQLTIANESIQRGARDFIVKPFESEKVLEVVSKNMI